MKLTPRIIGTSTLAQYLNFVREHEAPQSYHVATLLTLFAALLERRLVINRGYTIRANLYTLLLGKPASRKTFGTRIVQKVIQEAGYDMDLEMGNATDEGLVTVMAAKEEKGESPVATVVAEEFTVLLGDKKYQTGMCDWLCRAYDGGPLKNTRRVDTYRTKDSFVSIVAGTTPKNLLKITDKVIDSGLSSRVWMVCEKGQERWTSKPKFDSEERKQLAERLKEVIDPLLSRDRIFFDPGPEADKVFDDWYMGPHREFVNVAEEGEDTWAGRRHDHVMRASVLFHLLDGGGLEGMTGEGIKRGIEFIEAMEPGMFEAYKWLTASEWGRVRQHLVNLLKRKGVMELRHVLAVIARTSGKAMDEMAAVRALLGAGEIRIDGSGGKAKVVYTGEQEEAEDARKDGTGGEEDRGRSAGEDEGVV